METLAELRVAFRPLCGAIGAEVSGVKIADLDEGTFEQVQNAFYKYTMLVFRDQIVDSDTQIKFTRRWGPVFITPYLKKVDGYSEVVPQINRGKAKTATELWHSDGSFFPNPPGIAILVSKVLPPSGGDTMFANSYAAYDALSDRMKQLLEGLRCIHVDTVLAKSGIENANAPDQSYPVVRTHPVTRRKSLYVNTMFSSHFDGMTKDESRGLLQFLLDHSSRHDFVYRHQWRLGDVVMWDNRCTLHYAVHDYGDAERVMHRTSVDAGGRPE